MMHTIVLTNKVLWVYPQKYLIKENCLTAYHCTFWTTTRILKPNKITRHHTRLADKKLHNIFQTKTFKSRTKNSEGTLSWQIRLKYTCHNVKKKILTCIFDIHLSLFLFWHVYFTVYLLLFCRRI